MRSVDIPWKCRRVATQEATANNRFQGGKIYLQSIYGSCRKGISPHIPPPIGSHPKIPCLKKLLKGRRKHPTAIKTSDNSIPNSVNHPTIKKQMVHQFLCSQTCRASINNHKLPSPQVNLSESSTTQKAPKQKQWTDLGGALSFLRQRSGQGEDKQGDKSKKKEATESTILWQNPNSAILTLLKILIIQY